MARRKTKRKGQRTATKPVALRRRSRLDEALVDRFCRLILKGLGPDSVCDYLGINPGNFWTWIKRGESYLEGDGEPKEHAIYAHFVLELKRAFARYKLRRVNALHTGKTWYRELAILERRDRKTWGKQDPFGGMTEDFDPDENFL